MMDPKTEVLRQELAAMEELRWQGGGVAMVLEVGDLAVNDGIWPQVSVKNVGVKGREWSVLPDCAFDRVVLHRAVEVCEWPEALLNEVWRVVRPDGLVAIVLPREGENGITRDEVKKLMEGARLRVLEVKPGGKRGMVDRLLPWSGRVWWVVAAKDVLGVRPLAAGAKKASGPLVRPAGVTG